MDAQQRLRMIEEAEKRAREHEARGEWALAASAQSEANDLKRGLVQIAGPLPRADAE